MCFAENLIALRRSRNWSQEELGAQLGVSRQTVSKWELGQTTPELEKLVAMAELFQISIDSLVGREGGQPTSSADTEEPPLDGDRHREEIYRFSRFSWNYEYVSQRRLLGLPLIHVKLGWDPRPAKGIVAIGNTAVGVVTIGGASVGIISLAGVSVGLLLALGGLSVGLFALGGLAVGGFTLGGLAVGQWFALGGGAISNGLAIGGGAVGHVAIGDEAVGEFAFSLQDSWTAAEAWRVIQRETPYLGGLVRRLLPWFR